MNDPNADLLFSVLALQNKFVTPDQLIQALNLWAINKQRPLIDVVSERGNIPAADRELLKRLVERQLEVHGDVEVSLSESHGVLDLAEHCSQIEDFELREQLQSIASRAANSQMAMTRLSVHDQPPQLKESGPKETGQNDSYPSAPEGIGSGSGQSESRHSSASQFDPTADTHVDSIGTHQRKNDLTDANSNSKAQSITSLRPASRSNSALSSKPNPGESSLDLTAASRPLTKESHHQVDRPRQSFAATGLPTSSRFSIVNSHAKGGLGEVFLARDNELDREVALKEIQRKYASNEEARIRFEFEACITGGLEHPGVVPVYAYGKYSDGRPFYAMRFIRGRSMKEEIADYQRKIEAGASENALRLALRALLNRFVDACQAIAYAHSRGVMHRDLKPANVMLGKFGETLVVDWGLAKTVGRDEYHATPDEVTLLPLSGASGSGTMQGSTLGTPGYMSPEQAAGRLNEMGAASDIFSLGATLYNILVGTAPFEGKKASEIVAKAAENQFVEPIKKLPRIPRQLNAIVMKAMSTHQADRYHTAMELAADVEAFLADDLVSAYTETVWERSYRWIRRHRTLATAAFVLVSTLGLASAIGAVLLNSEKNRTQLALDQVSKEQTRTAAALKQAKIEEEMKSKALDALTTEQDKTQHALAALTIEQMKTQQALTAETQARRQTREMLNTISDDLVGELMGQQVELTPSNQRFFEGVLRQFEQFTTSMGSSTEAQNLRADGYFRVANLQRRLGRWDQAQTGYAQAIELWKKLTAEVPNNLNFQQDLAAAQANLGLVYADRSNLPAALEQYMLAAKQFSEVLSVAKSALESAEAGDTANPKNENQAVTSETSLVSTRANSMDAAAIHKVELELARLNGNIGNTLVNLNRRDEAEPFYERALETLANLKSSSVLPVEFDQAKVLGNYAVCAARESGRLPEARKMLEDAIATLSSTSAHGGGALSPKSRLDRSQYQKMLGKILVAQGEKERAIENSRVTVSDLNELVNEFPAVMSYRRELAVNQFNLANLLLADQPEQATTEFGAAIESLEGIIANDPKENRTRQELAASLERWGTSLSATKFDAAKEYFEKARKLRLDLHQAEPDNPTLRDEWFVGENNLANQYRDHKEYPSAIPIYKNLIRILEQTQEPENDPLFATKLRMVRFGLADSFSRTDQYQDALPIWVQLVENREDEDWAVFEFQRAICLIRTGDIEGGLAAGQAVLKCDKPEPVWYFDMACCYAIANELSANQDEKDIEPDEKSRKQREEWGAAAIKYLNLAGEAGFFESPDMRVHALNDKDLKSLKNRPDFEAFRKKYLNPAEDSY